MSSNHFTDNSPFHTLDLNFLGLPGTIAAYLIPHAHGAALVECGPGSTIPSLERGLSQYGLTPSNISDVFLTHIHLDHAGAAGWMARQGARIHVHPAGAPHLINPEKLLASAQRIYGDKMQELWGDFLPVPEEKLSILQDDEVVEFNGQVLRAVDTPGHANHHFAYIFNDLCFTGDIGGVRMQRLRHLRVPMPPPEFHLETWRASIKRLSQELENGKFQRIAPTHFGVFNDPGWHLTRLVKTLDEIEAWILAVMPDDPPLEEI